MRPQKTLWTKYAHSGLEETYYGAFPEVYERRWALIRQVGVLPEKHNTAWRNTRYCCTIDSRCKHLQNWWNLGWFRQHLVTTPVVPLIWENGKVPIGSATRGSSCVLLATWAFRLIRTQAIREAHTCRMWRVTGLCRGVAIISQNWYAAARLPR